MQSLYAICHHFAYYKKAKKLSAYFTKYYRRFFYKTPTNLVIHYKVKLLSNKKFITKIKWLATYTCSRKLCYYIYRCHITDVVHLVFIYHYDSCPNILYRTHL